MMSKIKQLLLAQMSHYRANATSPYRANATAYHS